MGNKKSVILFSFSTVLQSAWTSWKHAESKRTTENWKWIEFQIWRDSPIIYILTCPPSQCSGKRTTGKSAVCTTLEYKRMSRRSPYLILSQRRLHTVNVHSGCSQQLHLLWHCVQLLDELLQVWTEDLKHAQYLLVTSQCARKEKPCRS